MISPKKLAECQIEFINYKIKNNQDFSLNEIKNSIEKKFNKKNIIIPSKTTKHIERLEFKGIIEYNLKEQQYKVKN